MGMFFGLFNKWGATVKKLRNNAVSVQEFVNTNERKTLYYSTPFIDGENGSVPNVVQKQDAETDFFPVFTTPAGLSGYMATIGCKQHMIIKGDLKSVLSSLDSHPLLREWGVVVDLQSSLAVEIPPLLRVQPKCLR